MTTLNENFMEPSVTKAREGLLTLTKTTLLPGIEINRFANTKRPDLYFTGPWLLINGSADYNVPEFGVLE